MYIYIYVYVYVYVYLYIYYVYIMYICIPEVLLSPSLFQELCSDLSTEVPWEKLAFLGRGRWSVSIFLVRRSVSFSLGQMKKAF